MNIKLVKSLQELAVTEKDEANPYQDAVCNPHLQTTLVYLILNDIRYFKSVQAKGHPLNAEALLTKLSAYVDLIDMNEIIKREQESATPPEVTEDPLEN